MPNRTTLAFGLALVIPIGAFAALNSSTAIRQAGSLATGSPSALRVGYDGDGCKGACSEEPMAKNALRPTSLRSVQRHEAHPPMTAEIPAPESGSKIGDFGDYFGAPKAPSRPIDPGGPIGALVGSLVGGMGGMLLAKFL